MNLLLDPDTPWDLMTIIVKFLRIIDIINLSESCQCLHDKITERFDELIYDISENSENSEIHYVGLQHCELFYVEYRRGKHNDSPDAPPSKPDIQFSIRDGEHILYFSDVKLLCDGPGSVIITINRLLQYTVYQFVQEIGPFEESSPNFCGWGNDDRGVVVLARLEKYSGIGQIVCTDWESILPMIRKSLMKFPDIGEMDCVGDVEVCYISVTDY